MGHEDEHGLLARVQLEQQVRHLSRGGGVEVAGGLVAQEEPGREDEGPGQRRALPLAARELRRPVVEPVAEAHAVEQVAGARLVVRPSLATTRVGTRTFSSTEHWGSRKWSWKTKPIARLRKAASSGSGRERGSSPSSVTRPAVGGSSVPRTWSRVLLPLPEGPMMQSDSPGPFEKDTSTRIGRGPRGVS